MAENPFTYSVATRIREPHFNDLLTPSKGSLLLDVGCGLGYFTDFFARRGAKVFGIDPDLSSLRRLRDSQGNRVAVAEASRLPFKSDCFDHLLCTEVLEHVADDRTAVSEISRVGKVGATVIITVPSHEGIFGSRIKNIAHKHEGGLEHHHRDGYRAREIKNLLAENGIRVTAVRYSMIFLTEIVMGITKLAYLSKGAWLTTQADLIGVGGSLPFKIWKLVFPLVLMLCRLEDRLLSKRAKGHMLLVKGTIKKGS